MPYEWIKCHEGSIRLYMDYETETEKKLKEYRREWQRANRKGKKYSLKTKRIKQSIKLEEKNICECGGGWLYKSNKNKHYQSKRHKNYIKDLISNEKLKPEIDEYI